MVVREHQQYACTSIALVGAALLSLLLSLPSAFAAPELEIAHSGKLICHLTCATYNAAFQRTVQSLVDRKAITADTARQILDFEKANPENRCSAPGLEKAPSDQRGCAEGTYLQELVPTGYEITGDIMCGGCPTFLGARWCETNIREREVEVLSLNPTKLVKYHKKGGAQFWNAPNKKPYFIKDLSHDFKMPQNAQIGIHLTPDEERAYQTSRGEIERNRQQIREKWSRYSEDTISLEYRCCEDRDGDGMPSCSPSSQQMVVSARDPNKYTTGMGLVGPDCDDTSATITPAKAGPTVKYIIRNQEWADQFEKTQGEDTAAKSFTVITPSDLLIDPGMCWINHDSLPFSVSLQGTAPRSSIPIGHPGFTFEPLPPDALSNEGGITEEQFPARRPPLNWKTTFGMTPDDIGPWFRDDADLENAIKMVSAKVAPQLAVTFNYGDGFSSTTDIGLSNCFTLHGGEGSEIAFRRGRTLETDLREVLRKFLIPYTSIERNMYSSARSALFFLAPFSNYKDRLQVSFDLSKVSEDIKVQRGEFFKDLYLASKGSACSASHTVLLHDLPGIYHAFARPGGDAYIRPYDASPSDLTAAGAKYDWPDTSITITHELGHAFGELYDEYVAAPQTDPKIPIQPRNCSVNPEEDFSFDGKAYAERPFPEGCGNHPDWLRPTFGSYMNNPNEEESTRSFNVVSCGYLVAKLRGGNPKGYYSYCSMLVGK